MIHQMEMKATENIKKIHKEKVGNLIYGRKLIREGCEKAEDKMTPNSWQARTEKATVPVEIEKEQG